MQKRYQIILDIKEGEVAVAHTINSPHEKVAIATLLLNDARKQMEINQLLDIMLDLKGDVSIAQENAKL